MPSMLFTFNVEIKMELTVYLFAFFDYGNLFWCYSFGCDIIPMKCAWLRIFECVVKDTFTFL